VRAAADGGAVLGKTDFTQHNAVQTQDQPRHRFSLGHHFVLSLNFASVQKGCQSTAYFDDTRVP
jgi:hypothetical protein